MYTVFRSAMPIWVGLSEYFIYSFALQLEYNTQKSMMTLDILCKSNVRTQPNIIRPTQ